MINGLLKRFLHNQVGQALPLALALLVVGSLMLAPAVSYAATSLKGSHIVQTGVNGIYAADAGVEKAFWYLNRGITPPEQLPETLNGMQVKVQAPGEGNYTLYLGQLVPPGGHSDYLKVKGQILPTGTPDVFEFTITVTWQSGSGTSIIHLTEIGARLPPGYTYVDGSVGDFPGNLSSEPPDETWDRLGAQMLDWVFNSPYPSVSQSNPEKTQSFYITGEGERQGEYTWIVANREDVGAVGEISGTWYHITSTAIDPATGEGTAKIVVDAIVGGGLTYILSWTIGK